MNFGKWTFKGDPSTQSAQLGGSNKLKQERNRAYLLIGLLLFVVGGMASAVTVLANIHTVIPVVSVIDANGHVVKQQVVNKEAITGQESFIQSQVYDFIMYCNTFDPDWRQHFADLCRLHSTQTVAGQYDAETSPDNPNNPYYQLGQGGRRYPKITGITSLGKDAYQVSFQSITEKAGSPPKTDYYTALVRYTFTFKPLALGDRWENALGYATTAYRKDQELSRQ
ncbi:type IV secretion system protein [Xanthomonas euvesicatoria pv. physalidis]|uniref:type IV secretion system protein n=1 Tax=Xanthomonas euvesicatoria TaxID=456327 RepID=UPI001C4538EB|nr:type IV secretion system protein [Xanthomonas euvesicatoria]MBV6690318.1 type IV secretion system protein [Xanthomonas euvesicatoria pv. physalidis]